VTWPASPGRAAAIASGNNLLGAQAHEGDAVIALFNHDGNTIIIKLRNDGMIKFWNCAGF
jgi:hypothetical protein